MNETSSNHVFHKTMLRKLVLIGMICGVVCSFSKLGWEVPFPPRTPARDETNPPQQLLQQVGFSHETTHAPYIYNENKVAIAPMIMHFGFSFTFAVLYVLAVEFFPIVKTMAGGGIRDLIMDCLSRNSTTGDGHKTASLGAAVSRAFVRIIRPCVLLLDGGVNSTIFQKSFF